MFLNIFYSFQEIKNCKKNYPKSGAWAVLVAFSRISAKFPAQRRGRELRGVSLDRVPDCFDFLFFSLVGRKSITKNSRFFDFLILKHFFLWKMIFSMRKSCFSNYSALFGFILDYYGDTMVSIIFVNRDLKDVFRPKASIP